MNMVVLAGLPLTGEWCPLTNVACSASMMAIYLGFVPKSLSGLRTQNFMKDAIITAVRILRRMFYLMERTYPFWLPELFVSDAVRCRLFTLGYSDLRGSTGLHSRQASSHATGRGGR